MVGSLVLTQEAVFYDLKMQLTLVEGRKTVEKQ